MSRKQELKDYILEQIEDSFDELRGAGGDFIHEFGIDDNDHAAIAAFEELWEEACDDVASEVFGK